MIAVGRDRRSLPGLASRGFTLLELLVVVVIIAIMTTVAMLSMNVLGQDNQVDDEAKRLTALIGVVREQAEMQSRDFGLRLQDTIYDFMVYNVRRDEWTQVEGDDLMRARELPKGLRFRLYLDGREAILKPLVPVERPKEGKKDERPEVLEIGEKAPEKATPPQIFILSSGDLSAFELVLEREGSERTATLTGAVDGKVEFKGVDSVAPKK